MKNTIHFIMQGKGGVGKTTVAYILIQALQNIADNDAGKPAQVVGIDTDPVNQTFSSFSSLKATAIDILGDDNEVNPLQFDVIIEAILNAPDSCFVIDNGATSYLPVFNYLKNNDIVDILADQGKTTYIHVPVSGGQAALDTLEELKRMTEEFPKAKIIIWENNHFGKIQEPVGTYFRENPEYTSTIKNAAGTVVLEKLDAKTTGYLYEKMTSELKTFADVACDPKEPFMTKQRLKKLFNGLSNQIFSAVKPAAFTEKIEAKKEKTGK